MVKNYIPSQGDIITLQFNPKAGREQAGLRPALVLSPKSYNQKVGLLVACPITSKQKGYPFEVPLPKKLKTHGVILSDHVKNLDWNVRKTRFVEKVPTDTLEETLSKLGVLLQRK